MTTATQQFTILDREFEVDELKDIANHGMSAGVGGFIYSTELMKCYDKHEDTILDCLDACAENSGDSSGMQMVIDSLTSKDDDVYYSMQNIKELAVWMYVELKAWEILVSIEHPDFV